MERVTVFEGDELHRDFAPVPKVSRCVIHRENSDLFGHRSSN